MLSLISISFRAPGASLWMTVKLHCFWKLVDHKENCTFDESGVMGWCSGGLASHRGALQLAPLSGKRSAENDKGWKQTSFFFLHLAQTKFQKEKKKKRKTLCQEHSKEPCLYLKSSCREPLGYMASVCWTEWADTYRFWTRQRCTDNVSTIPSPHFRTISRCIIYCIYSCAMLSGHKIIHLCNLGAKSITKGSDGTGTVIHLHLCI